MEGGNLRSDKTKVERHKRTGYFVALAAPFTLAYPIFIRRAIGRPAYCRNPVEPRSAAQHICQSFLRVV